MDREFDTATSIVQGVGYLLTSGGDCDIALASGVGVSRGRLAASLMRLPARLTEPSGSLGPLEESPVLSGAAVAARALCREPLPPIAVSDRRRNRPAGY